MTVRPALPADAPAIAAVEARASAVCWTEDAIRRTLLDPSTEGWVAGRPVHGHVLCRRTLDEAEILTLAVDPDHRRRGRARELLLACEERWRQAGVRTAWLEVRVDNEPALALYRSHGWRDAGRRPAYYSDGSDARILVWSL